MTEQPAFKWHQLKDLYQTKLKKYDALIFFVGGLLYDILTLDRIDSLFNLIQLSVFILVLSLILMGEAVQLFTEEEKPLPFPKFWKYHIEIMHFILGSLLSAFTLFYFKSSSLANSSLFIFLMAFLLVANEISIFKSLGFFLRFVMFSFCVVSFFNILVPIFFGKVGHWVFITSMILSTLYLMLHLFIVKWKISKMEFIVKQGAIPATIVMAGIITLYVFEAIPPVPISIQEMGIYHKVEKLDGGYLGHHENPWWKFWNQGDIHFKAREGDAIYFFARIFSPGNFSEETKLSWLHKSRGKWQTWDTIPIKITGGRAQGFRGYAYKKNFTHGDWQVRVQTRNGREIGRIYFTVSQSQEVAERNFSVDIL